jgi:hypothetical protein
MPPGSARLVTHLGGAGQLLPKATIAQPNYLAVQTGEAQHVMLGPSYLQFINHSCDPKGCFNTDKMQLQAL